MAGFVPEPRASFAPQRAAHLARIRALNPTASPEQLDAYVEKQLDAFASRDFQFFDRFDQRHMTEYVTVVILSHALSEALINAVLAIGLAQAGTSDLFPLLEKADFTKKWLLGAKSFAPAYTFPHDTALYESLVVLARQRNALVHYKLELTVDGKKVLDGSGFERKRHAEETRWLRRFFSLPYDLAEHASNALPRVPLTFLRDRSPIEPSRAHNAV